MWTPRLRRVQVFCSQAHQDVVNSKIEIYLQSCIKYFASIFFLCTLCLSIFCMTSYINWVESRSFSTFLKLYYVHRNHEIQYVDKVDIFIPMRGRALLLIKSCRIHTYNSTLAWWFLKNMKNFHCTAVLGKRKKVIKGVRSSSISLHK